MSYTLDHRAGEKDAPLDLQTSANSWQELASGRVRPRNIAVKMGGRTVILPAFSRAKFLGDNGAGLTVDQSSISDLVDVPSDLGTSLVDQSGPQTYDATGQSLTAAFSAPPSYLNQTESVSQAVAAGASPPGTAAYQALIASGQTAAQIAAAVKPAAAAAPAAATASIIPGLSNTAALIGGLVILMVLASGKKR